MRITYYAGAADAAGTSVVDLDESGTLCVGVLRDRLSAGNPRLAAVLPHCTLLVDGTAVTDPAGLIGPQARVDVLPPFAGG